MAVYARKLFSMLHRKGIYAKSTLRPVRSPTTQVATVAVVVASLVTVSANSMTDSLSLASPADDLSQLEPAIQLMILGLTLSAASEAGTASETTLICPRRQA